MYSGVKTYGKSNKEVAFGTLNGVIEGGNDAN